MRAYSDPEPPIRRNQPYRNLPAHSAGVTDRERRPEPYGPTDRPGKRNRPDRRARPDRPGRPGRHRRPTRTDRASLLWGYLPLVLASRARYLDLYAGLPVGATAPSLPVVRGEPSTGPIRRTTGGSGDGG